MFLWVLAGHWFKYCIYFHCNHITPTRPSKSVVRIGNWRSHLTLWKSSVPDLCVAAGANIILTTANHHMRYPKPWTQCSKMQNRFWWTVKTKHVSAPVQMLTYELNMLHGDTQCYNIYIWYTATTNYGFSATKHTKTCLNDGLNIEKWLNKPGNANNAISVRIRGLTRWTLRNTSATILCEQNPLHYLNLFVLQYPWCLPNGCLQCPPQCCKCVSMLELCVSWSIVWRPLLRWRNGAWLKRWQFMDVFVVIEPPRSQCN